MKALLALLIAAGGGLLSVLTAIVAGIVIGGAIGTHSGPVREGRLVDVATNEAGAFMAVALTVLAAGLYATYEGVRRVMRP